MRWTPFLATVLAWPVLGGNCFCLVDADDAVWFDCREQTRAGHTEPRLFCTDATTDKQVDLTGRQGLTRVAGGDSPCTPCRLSEAADLGHTIRGEGDEPEAAGQSTNSVPIETKPASGKERP